jgi:hypothetical protein
MPRKKKNRGYTGRWTGHEYTKARGLGDYRWEPQSDSWQNTMLPEVQQVLVDNAAYLPLRPRAILYRLMGKRLATKADNDRLIDLISSARRAGFIEWDDIDDGRTVFYDIGGFDDPKHFWQATVERIEQVYRRRRRQGQKYFIELWVESAGYLPVLERTAAAYGAVLISGSGFNPIKRIRQSALDAHARLKKDGQRTVLIFLGDLDEAGITRIERSDADIRQFFTDAMGGDDEIVTMKDGREIPVTTITEFVITSEWLGLRHEQAVDLKLLDENGDPAQSGKPGKFELEAVPPAIVVGWVQEAFERYTDMDVLQVTKDAADEERTRMMDALKRMIKRWK